jgi:FAD/FMN-containing dehydrogenase
MEPAITLELPAGFRGQVFRPGDAGYDEGRSVVNGMIDRRPALVVRPTGAADIVDAVNLAREAGLPVGVRCGGHSVAGNGVTDGGVQIDLSALKGVRVDPSARRATASAGTLWGEFDRETQLFGLATPGGRVTSTGVGGFTTGGGYGWLSPVYGLTCDNLLAADVVTADGRLVHASADENADLLWGLRGGGSNFGIVTSFEFQLHPVGPIVLAGMLVHLLDDAAGVVREWRDYVEAAPEELVTALAIVQAPPAPFVPPELVGTPVLGILAMYVGDPADGEVLMRGLRSIGPPAQDLIEPMPYTAFQAMLDDFAPEGWRNYHGGMHVATFPDAAIDAFLATGPQRLSPMTQAIVFRNGGAVARVPADFAAAGNRDAPYMAHPLACWPDAADDDANIAWTRRYIDALTPWGTGRVYLNFEQDEGAALVRRGFDRDAYARLVALKDRWDPGNVFRVNQNIAPSGVARMPGQREQRADAAQPRRP